MKLISPAKADQQPEIQAGKGQADGVIGAEDEAQRALPANEPGDRGIHFARDAAHGVKLGAGHPGIDTVHHAVPVEKHVESDHRRDHEKPGNIDQGFPRIPQGLKQRGEKTGPCWSRELRFC